MAFELINGHLYLHLDLGSGAAKVKATTRRVDDGAWHEATLRRSGLDGRVTVDGTASDFTTPGKGDESISQRTGGSHQRFIQEKSLFII